MVERKKIAEGDWDGNARAWNGLEKRLHPKEAEENSLPKEQGMHEGRVVFSRILSLFIP